MNNYTLSSEPETASGKIGKRDGFSWERMFIVPPDEISVFKEHPLVKRMFLTDAGFFPTAQNHYRERTEGIDEYIFFFCIAGSGFVYVEDREYIISKNQAFCIPSACRHRYYASEEDPWSIYWLHLRGEDTKYFPLRKCRAVQLMSVDRMEGLFDRLFQVLECERSLGNFIYISQVLMLILAETYEREKSDNQLGLNMHVDEIIRYMKRHLSENLTLKQITSEFELSKSYLNVLFKKHTGRSPMDFYNSLKMREACKALRTKMYVYEVAYMLGYSDQYYFARLFKKLVGVSPGEYKRGVKGSE